MKRNETGPLAHTINKGGFQIYCRFNCKILMLKVIKDYVRDHFCAMNTKKRKP
jgi:hypothetical protein